jgi:cation transport ATPase
VDGEHAGLVALSDTLREGAAAAVAGLESRGIDVVMLEAGGRQSTDSYVQDEWASFLQLAWLAD